MGNNLLKFLLISLFIGYFSSLGFSQCTYSVQLYNQNGNGWDADRLTVLVNGSAVHTNIYLLSGSGPSAYNVPVNHGDIILFSYADNSYPGLPVNINPGNYFKVYDGQGNLVQTYGLVPDAGLSTTGGGIITRGPLTASCPVIDLAVTGITQNTPATPGIVTVNLKNNGSVTASGFNVTLNVTGNLAVNIPYAGSIPAGGTGSINFTGVTFPLNINITSATHDLAGDQNASNDIYNGLVYNLLNDLEVMSVSCTPGSATSSVTIMVRNNGPITLNGVAGKFPISYTVNSGTPVTEDYIPVAFVSGSTIPITFGTTANLSLGGSYSLLGYASFYGDLNIANNQASNSFFIGGDLAVSWATIGGGCGSTVPRVQVTNVDDNAFTIDAGTVVFYNINANPAVNYTFPAPVTLAAGESQIVSFPAANLSTATSYTAGFAIPFVDNDISNNSITGTFTGSPLAISYPFLYPNFGGSQYFSYLTNSDATNYISGNNLILAGEGTPSLPPTVAWVGGFDINGTDELDVWTSNTTHISSAILCEVNTATISPNAELLLDIQQEFTIGPGYTWFRVLRDGVPLTDINSGKSVFSPEDYVTPSAWQTLRFNLPSTSSFVITLQASNNFAGNLTRINNIKIRQKPSVDVGVFAILNPVSGCGLVNNPSVSVKIKNFGANNVSGITVSANINGLGVVSAVHAPTLPPNGTATITLVPGYTVTYPATIVATATKAGDTEAINNSMTVTVMDYASTIPYSTNFTTNPYFEGWSNIDNNGGNEWQWVNESLGDNALAFNFNNLGGNDAVFTKCLKVNSVSDQILVDFWYSTLNGSTGRNLEFVYNTSPSLAGALSLGSWTNVNTTGSYASSVLTGLTPGTPYYFGWYVTGNATIAAEYVIIDDFEAVLFGPTDLQVTNVALSADDCIGLSNENVTITVQNNGPYNLNAGTVIPVSFTLNPGAVTVAENMVLASNLLVGNTAIYSFTGGANMTSANIYTVTGDVNFGFELTPANDQASDTRTTYGYPQNLVFNQSGNNYCYSNGPSITIAGSHTVDAFAAPYDGTFSGTQVTEDGVNNQANFNFPVLAGGQSGSYTVTYTVENVGGCSSFVNGVIGIGNPVVTLPADFASLDYTTVTIDAGAGTGPLPYTYMWNDLSTNQVLDPAYYGHYSVVVTQGPANCTVTDDIWIYQRQEIALNGGWGMMSTLINTAIAPDVNDSIYEYFNDGLNPGLKDELVIIKDYAGRVYWPSIPILPTPNNIEDFVIGAGYQYKMFSNQTLKIEGIPLVPQVTPINLVTGYNFIGYLRQTSAPIVPMLASVSGNPGFLVKDELGKLYWPTYGINTILNMQPGKGYKVRSLSPTFFLYPANTIAFPIANDKDGSLVSSKYRLNERSGMNMVMAIPVSAWDINPQIGDEVGVFDAQGNLVGSGIFDGGNIAMTIWGDDETTKEKDGLVAGEYLSMKIWSKLNNSESVLEVENWIEGANVYSTDGVSVAGKLKVVSNMIANNFQLFQNIPNPVSDVAEIQFYLSQSGNTELVVLNVLGKVVATLASGSYSEGYHSVNLDVTQLASGTYYYKLISGDDMAVKSFSVQK
jgi:hypothetical protein